MKPKWAKMTLRWVKKRPPAQFAWRGIDGGNRDVAGIQLCLHGYLAFVKQSSGLMRLGAYDTLPLAKRAVGAAIRDLKVGAGR